MTLWLVRHAQPLIAPGICYGQLDVPADAEATQRCAQALHHELLARAPEGIDIISSPLQRCEQLAQTLLGLEPLFTYKTDLRLKEMNFGAWEGQPWADIGKLQLDDWSADFASYPVGGNGESVTEVMDRVRQAMAELTDVQTAQNEKGRAPRNTLWITHAGIIRAASLIAAGIHRIERADQWPTAAPAYGQWCKLKLSPSGV